MAKTKERSAAKLTIRKAAHMHDDEKHRVAQWLRTQARRLEKEGHGYAPRFTARYLY